MAALDRVIAFLKAIWAAVLALFKPQSMTTDSLNVATAGDLGPLGQFILSLTCNEDARNLWLTNRAQAIATSGLSQTDQDLLTGGNLQLIVPQVVMESGGSGQRHWICVWIR